MGFIDTMRAEDYAVESICRVPREQDCRIAARTYRSWKQTTRPIAARTISDAHVVDAVRNIAWTTEQQGRRRLAPEGLYGRRKMTACVRRTVLPEASAGSVDRAMRTLELLGVRRDKGVRTTIPGKDGIRATVFHNGPYQTIADVEYATAGWVDWYVGICGGYGFSVLVQHASPGLFVTNLTLLVHFQDFLVGEIKAFVFGFSAGIVACFRGLRAGGGPLGVGQAVNETVVYSFMLLLFFFNTLISTVALQFTS